MDPAVGLAVFLLEVDPERFKLFESNQGDLSPWVYEPRPRLYVESNKLVHCVREAEG